MAVMQKFTVRKRRRREGKTDYKRRLKLLLSNKPRMVVRRSIDNMTVQLVEYSPKGDRVVVAAHSNQLKKLGWKFNKSNLPASYLLGMLFASKAKKKKHAEAILDTGLQESVKGSKIYAVLKGAVDNGMHIPHSPEVLPDEKRVSGASIVEFAKKIKAEGNKSQFSKYDVDQFQKNFEEIKNKIKSDK